jgi:hypothetical protein
MPSWQADEVIVVDDLSAGPVARLTPTSLHKVSVTEPRRSPAWLRDSIWA